MGKKVVTNLRIDENDWLQIKAIAAELGMSANEYINLISQEAVSKAFLGKSKHPQKVRVKKTIIDGLLSLSKKGHKDKPMGLSKDDQTIYGP